MKIYTEVLDATLTLDNGDADTDEPINNLLSRVRNKIFGIGGSTDPDVLIDFGSAFQPDYILFDNVTCGTPGELIVKTGNADNGSDFENAIQLLQGIYTSPNTLTNDQVNFFLINPEQSSVTNKRYWYFQFGDVDSHAAFKIGNIFMGNEYETPRASKIPIKIGNDFNVFSNTIGNIDYTSITGLSTDNKTNADNYFERGLKFNRFTEAQLETFRAEIKDNLNGVQKPFYVECEDGTYRLVYIENMYIRYGKKNKDDYGFTLNLKELV